MGSASGNKRTWKVVAICVVISWIFTGLLWYATWEFYVSTKPRNVEVVNGRTIPLSSHGIVVYLTESERDRLKLLNRCCYGFTFAFVLIYIFKNPFTNAEEHRSGTST